MNQKSRSPRLLFFVSGTLLFSLFLASSPIFGQVTPEETINQFRHAENLEVTLWASEPMLSNPTTMDIDSRGRIWVTEGLNYRLFRSKNFKRVPGADAIKILEDTDHDGKADKVTVFADNLFPVPMGIAIEEIYNSQGKQTGTRVYVGNAPNLLVLEDTDGDDRADKKFNLLTGFGALDSDHGLHGMALAMDGKLYFTHGDGKHGEPNQYKNKKDPSLVYDIFDKSGRRIVHKDRGSTLRVNLDGTNLEILGIRFRNNYEVCVDSFGRVFVSDNDDDGNRGSRMAWVMRGGNYGYQIPGSNHHWAEDMPGYIPKTAGTGNGSPAGILVYEGDLFGEEMKGAVLQIDARTRQINLHPINRVGGGIRTEYKILLTGGDSWYRPIDAAVGPDGAIYIADWYDAGVGGNRFVDQTTGRIYRLAPKGTPTRFEPARFQTIDDLVKGVQSPVASTRFAARQALVNRQSESFPTVKKLYKTGSPELKGRALQILSSMGNPGKEVLLEGLKDSNPSLKELSLQLLARNLITNHFHTKAEKPIIDQALLSQLSSLKNDPDSGVRRELLLSLQDVPLSYVKETLIDLALSWDGQDRYYLEAVLLAVKNRDDQIKKEILEQATANALKDPEQLNRDLALPPYFPTSTNDGFLRPGDSYPKGNPASLLIGLSWGLEWEGSLPYLETLLDQTKSPAILKGVELAASRLPSKQAGDFFAKQFLKSKETLNKKELLGILSDKFQDAGKKALENPLISKVIEESLNNKDLQSEAIRALGKIRLSQYNDILMPLVSDESKSASVRASAIYALGRLKYQPLSTSVQKIIEQTRETNNVTSLVKAAIRAHANLNADQSINLMQKILQDEEHGLSIKREAIKVLASTQAGANLLLKIGTGKLIPKELYPELVSLTHNHPDRNIRKNARRDIPLPPSAMGKPLPPIAELISRTGNAGRGEAIFFRANHNDVKSPECSSCHRVQGQGQSIGPDLSTIGVKFGKKEMLESILNPNGAISFNYQTEIFMMEDGRVFYGLVESESPGEVILRTAQKEKLVLDKSEIEERKIGNTSIMPEGLARLTTEQELVDLLAYLATLRKPSVTITRYQASVVLGGEINKKITFSNKTVSTNKEGKLEISKFMEPKDYQQVLTTIKLNSSIEQQAKIVFESNMDLRVLLNKDKSLTMSKSPSGKSSFAKVKLNRGINKLGIYFTPNSETDSLTTSIISEVAVQLKDE